MKGGEGQRINLMFRAFSDRTRMRILYLIQQGDMCVGDIVRVLRVPQPTASRHLAYLRRAGLVQARRDGAWTYYSLTPARLAFHRHLIQCLRSCLRQVPEMAADAARAAKLRVKSHLRSKS